VSEPELRALEDRLGPERSFRVARRVAGWQALDGGATAPPGRAFLLAAIARPERFERDVAGAGVAVVGRAFFRDHYRFRADDLARVAEEARAARAEAIVTTAKDAVASRERTASACPSSCWRLPPTSRTSRACERGCSPPSGGPPEAREASSARGGGGGGGVRNRPEAAPPRGAGRRPEARPALGLARPAPSRDRRLQPAPGLPEWDEARIEATARGVYAHFGAVLLDLLWMEGRPAEELLALADLEGVEHLQAARAAGRGVVAPSGHFGNWEFQAIASVPSSATSR